ncbi:hypothetical protein PAXINDRAFT_156403 [Paxillus involutus ATCC 200175]|uniref:Uncharacterized protein n=1 Tax=Paxillus involutus ATCC 200175 TaxID=664439 RepID=A0A0C9TDP9_PAXIN|nr:hypothetical protein PAXINDRAFT_156403 [Paxillus involutus ATCC 200175]
MSLKPSMLLTTPCPKQAASMPSPAPHSAVTVQPSQVQPCVAAEVMTQEPSPTPSSSRRLGPMVILEDDESSDSSITTTASRKAEKFYSVHEGGATGWWLMFSLNTEAHTSCFTPSEKLLPTTSTAK